MPSPPDQDQVLGSYRLTAGGFVLATVHRPDNVDHAHASTVLDGLVGLPWPVVLLSTLERPGGSRSSTWPRRPRSST